MPLQLEAFLPFVIIGGALCAAAPILNYTHRYFNKGKVITTALALLIPAASPNHDGPMG